MKRLITLCAAMILCLLLCAEAVMDLEEIDFAASVDPFVVKTSKSSAFTMQVIETPRDAVTGFGSAAKVVRVRFPADRLGGLEGVEGLQMGISSELLLDEFVVGAEAITDLGVNMPVAYYELPKQGFVDYAGVVEAGSDRSISMLTPEPATTALLGLSSVSLIYKKRI